MLSLSVPAHVSHQSGEIPAIWRKYSIPDIPVTAWVTDFIKRVNQLIDVARPAQHPFFASWSVLASFHS